MGRVNSAADVPRVGDLLCFSLHVAARASESSYRPVLEPLSLTYPQFLVMLALWREDGQCIGEICSKLYLESGTVTPLLKRLESSGRVKRCRDASDERIVRVTLTREGRALRPPVLEGVMNLACKLAIGQEAAAKIRDQLHGLRDMFMASANR